MSEVDQSRFGPDFYLFISLSSGFLSSFEKSRLQEQEAMAQAEENIVSLLELCSRVRRNRRRRKRRRGESNSVLCLEHDATASRGHGDRRRAEEHAGRAGQQGDGGGPVQEHGQGAGHRSASPTHGHKVPPAPALLTNLSSVKRRSDCGRTWRRCSSWRGRSGVS